MASVELTSKNFEQTISDNPIVLVDFWAPWCRPCRQFGPIFEQVSDKHPDIVFGKVNTEEEHQLAAAGNISSIPTLMAFRDGIALFNQAGALPVAALEELVQQIRDVDMEAVKDDIERQRQEND